MVEIIPLIRINGISKKKGCLRIESKWVRVVKTLFINKLFDWVIEIESHR